MNDIFLSKNILTIKIQTTIDASDIFLIKSQGTYISYKPNPDIINQLINYKFRLSFEVIAGKWCGDNFLYLPVFLKVMNALNMSHEQIKLFG